jgi:FkbM family methyltransferase
MIGKVLRNLSPFKGKQRLARLLLSKYIAKSHDVSIEVDKGYLFKIPTLTETIGFELFINGVYERETVDFIVQRIKNGSVFIDIGANIGAISIPVCKQFDNISLIAIEAAPWLFSYLQSNIRNNDVHNSTLINKAISDVSGRQVLFYSPHDKFGKGSLAPVFTSEGVQVETITLDQIAAPFKAEDISFIKIDIEGFEYFAFLGGAKILGCSNAPDILFEFAAWAEDVAPGIKAGDAQELLMSYGYNIYLFDKGKPSTKLKSPERKTSSMFFATKSLK